MFNLPYALGVSPHFLHLVLSETFLNGGVPVGRCVGIEHPDVQKGPLKSSSPESVDGDIQSLSVVKAWVRLFETLVCHHYFATVYSYTSVSVIAC